MLNHTSENYGSGSPTELQALLTPLRESVTITVAEPSIAARRRSTPLLAGRLFRRYSAVGAYAGCLEFVMHTVAAERVELSLESHKRRQHPLFLTREHTFS